MDVDLEYVRLMGMQVDVGNAGATLNVASRSQGALQTSNRNLVDDCNDPRYGNRGTEAELKNRVFSQTIPSFISTFPSCSKGCKQDCKVRNDVAIGLLMDYCCTYHSMHCIFTMSSSFLHSNRQPLDIHSLETMREDFWGEPGEEPLTTTQRRHKLEELLKKAHDPGTENFTFKFAGSQRCENYTFHCLGLKNYHLVKKVKESVIHGTLPVIVVLPLFC
jgi:hypothetical protein